MKRISDWAEEASVRLSTRSGEGADIIVGLEGIEVQDGEQLYIRVPSPLQASIERGLPLHAGLIENDEEAHSLLATLVDEAKAGVRWAVAHGFGVFYVLNGAHPGVASPMQYGGFYLELDREILGQCDPEHTLLWVMGDESIYVDALEDLPAGAIGWKPGAVDASESELKEQIQKVIFSGLGESNFQLVQPFDVANGRREVTV